MSLHQRHILFAQSNSEINLPFGEKKKQKQQNNERARKCACCQKVTKENNAGIEK